MHGGCFTNIFNLKININRAPKDSFFTLLMLKFCLYEEKPLFSYTIFYLKGRIVHRSGKLV